MFASHTPSLDRTLPHNAEHLRLSAGHASTPWPRSILVAVDGTVATDPAIEAAHALAMRAGSTVDVAAIYAPRIPLPSLSKRRGIGACERSDRRDAARLVATVRARCRELVSNRSERSAWAFHLEVGDPGATLVRIASEIQADLVIVGIAQLDPFDSFAGGRTAICAARYLAAPLLAAAPTDDIATRAIVVLPKGQLHAPTLRAALVSVARPAKLWIVSPERHAAFEQDIEDADAIAAAVGAHCGVEVAAMLDDVRLERVDVSGDLLSATLRLAEEVDAQLIAVPNHGDPGPVRNFLPNLAEPLLMAARCSVLVVPDPADSTRARA